MSKSFYDATCPKCQGKIGWFGEIADKPPCTSCGHTDSPEELARQSEEMKEIERKLFGGELEDPPFTGAGVAPTHEPTPEELQVADVVGVTIKECPRCKEPHDSIAHKLVNPSDSYTHYGICPKANQPFWVSFNPVPITDPLPEVTENDNGTD